MKKIYLLAVLAGCLAICHQTVKAQDHEVVYISAMAEWVPQKGFWVVESNKKTPRQHTIFFYNDQHVLVYKEELTGLRVNLKKEKVKLRLKEALENALVVWEENRQLRENQKLVLNQLRSK